MKARGADGVGSPLVVRGRDSNRSVFTDSLLHTLLGGRKKRALTGANQYSEITQSVPEIKQNPPGGVAGRVAWIGAGDRGAGAPIGGCETWRVF